MDNSFYHNKLYPFQDQVLPIITGLDTSFYLTGDTALSRGYLTHRFSDDLDLFVNDDAHFLIWADRVVHALSLDQQWELQVMLRDERYVRINLRLQDFNLKIEMVNDVPSRIGEPWLHPYLGRIDTAENILANKITAVLDRAAPKDLADIWGLCYLKGLTLSDAIIGAQGKAAGVFPVDLARVLCTVTRPDWELVRWIDPPDPDQYIAQIIALGQSLLFPY